jgi:homotetrameric cytidine deaminase
MLIEEELQKLFRLARETAANAYAPYSGFQVGAAILLADGRIFTGVNVENISYGLTNCAERTAIFRAVAETPGGKIRVRAIANAAASGVHCSPCGACRPVLAEFSTRETVVLYQGPHGPVTTTIADLLPDSFRF